MEAIATSVRMLLDRSGPVMTSVVLVEAGYTMRKLMARSRESHSDFTVLQQQVGTLLCDTLGFIVTGMEPYYVRAMDEVDDVTSGILSKL